MPVNTPRSAPDPNAKTRPHARQRTRGGEPDNRAEVTRQAILDAALEVFTEQTYGGARIENIAERAGVAMGTIYKYFPSKLALVNEVFRFWKLKTKEYSYPASGRPSRERFHDWVSQVADFANKYPLAHEFLLTHHHAPYLDKTSRAIGEPMDKRAADSIRDGQRAGEIRKGDPELLAAMVLGVFNSVTREMRTRGKKLDDKAIALAEESAWDLLRSR